MAGQAKKNHVKYCKNQCCITGSEENNDWLKCLKAAPDVRNVILLGFRILKKKSPFEQTNQKIKQSFPFFRGINYHLE